jgi:hypothetical protein
MHVTHAGRYGRSQPVTRVAAQIRKYVHVQHEFYFIQCSSMSTAGDSRKPCTFLFLLLCLLCYIFYAYVYTDFVLLYERVDVQFFTNSQLLQNILYYNQPTNASIYPWCSNSSNATVPPLLILTWTQQYSVPFDFGCSNGAYICKTTTDKTQIDKAAAVVFYPREMQLHQLPPVKSRRPWQT